MGAEIVAHQGVLEEVVNKLFHGFNILKNVRRSVNITYPETGSFLELDVWIPDISVAFEYQDQYHYITNWECNAPLAQVQLRDNIKQSLVHANGWTLISVPCWWDGRAESLMATILFNRPELTDLVLGPHHHYDTPHQHGDNLDCDGADARSPPTPLCPLLGDLDFSVVPDIGELMLASFPNSSGFDQKISVENPWWMGEKYDGLRFCWSATHKTLYSRTGVEISIPTAYYKFPANIFYDGEIWFGRGCYPESQKLLFSDFWEPQAWHWLRIVVFDRAESTFNSVPFEQRYHTLLQSVPCSHSSIIVAARMGCNSKRQLTLMSLWMISTGGEGVVLRRPGSPYVRGRNDHLFKLKASRADREALVLNVRHDSVELQLPDGVLFEVPVENLVDIAPNRGDIVSFSYERFSRKAIPVDPVLYRVRMDLTWEHVVQDYKRNASQPLILNDVAQQTFGHTDKPFGYWTTKKGKNMRVFMERFAKDNNFDPLVAENWYQYSRLSIAKLQGSGSILSHHQGSFIKALQSLFPDIGLDEAKFNILRKGFWQVESKRELLEQFAKLHQFDPLIAENWYSVTTDQILALKGASTLLQSYTSVPAAIVHLFPEVNLVEHQFLNLRRDYWKIPVNQRKLLEHYARRNGMNPRLPSVWYEMPRDKILYMKRKWKPIFLHYKSSFVRAAVALFPDLNLDSSKFSILQYSHWQDENNRRKFFDKFARMNQFNPLIASNWYSIKKKQITAQPGGAAVLSYYKKNSLAKALVHIYPQVKFDKLKFLFLPHNYNKPNVRKGLFIDFAAERGFEPLIADNWYSVSRSEIASLPGANAMLRCYNGSIPNALVSLFPDIGLDRSKFSIVPHKYWQDAHNRRQFFIDYSKKRGFDALVALNWYAVSVQNVMSIKGASTVLRYYNGTIMSALHHLFPDVHFDMSKFNDVNLSTDIPVKQEVRC